MQKIEILRDIVNNVLPRVKISMKRFSTCFWERKRGSTKPRDRKYRGRNPSLIIFSKKYPRAHFQRSEERSSEKNAHGSFYLGENLVNKRDDSIRNVIEEQLFGKISVSDTFYTWKRVIFLFFLSSLPFRRRFWSLLHLFHHLFSCNSYTRRSKKSISIPEHLPFPNPLVSSSRRRSISLRCRTRMTFGCAFARASGSVATPVRRIKHRDFGFT